MALDPQLLEILACPEDKGPLLYFQDEDTLYNPRLKRRYAIRDDIPIMLIDEAETVDDAEHERLVAKSYELPAFVSDESLVFAVSYSGDTEETIEAVTEAAVQGAMVVAVTTGGELARLAEAWGAPLVPVPSDIPQPRAALGALAVPPLVVLEELGLFPGASQWIDLAVRRLRARRDELTAPGSLAERLARHIGRTIPLIYGGGLGAVAAQRWKTQLNENAKIP